MKHQLDSLKIEDREGSLQIIAKHKETNKKPLVHNTSKENLKLKQNINDQNLHTNMLSCAREYKHLTKVQYTNFSKTTNCQEISPKKF